MSKKVSTDTASVFTSRKNPQKKQTQLNTFALSIAEVEAYLKKDNLKVILYDQLKGLKLDDLFDSSQYAIILIQSDQSEVGHFVSVINHGLDESGRFVIEYFDPLGGQHKWPDYTQKFINKRPENREKTYISDILNDAKCKVIINNHNLQDKKSNNCGKWCIARCISAPTTIDNFADIFMNHKTLSSDDIVTQLIRIHLKR